MSQAMKAQARKRKNEKFKAKHPNMTRKEFAKSKRKTKKK